MRKDKEQQKRINASQLKLFIGGAKPTGQTIGRTDGDSQSGVELSSRLENQRTLTSNLLDKIVDYENLTRAYKQVRRNKGSGGVDEMEVEDLGRWLRENVEALCTSILN